jgi:transposase InsO family protein
MMAEVMGVKPASLKRWMVRREGGGRSVVKKRGRPQVVPASVRLKIRNCYIAHYKQWGPRVLASWVRREGLGNYSHGTISTIIEDLKEKTVPKDKPRRYEITAPNVMWSEDGAGFRERGRKKELLLVQDECSRFKINTRLVDGPANSENVCDYLREAFDKHGAPLILKHDGGSIFHEEDVNKLLAEYGVISLKSPPRYPPFNGKMERSVRDIKSYERAMNKHEVTSSLKDRINAAIHDLNEERPRPILGGKTAREVFKGDSQTLPDRKRFYKEVRLYEQLSLSYACSRKQKDAARRRAVELVLLRQGLLKEITDVSTYLKAKTGTN